MEAEVNGSKTDMYSEEIKPEEVLLCTFVIQSTMFSMMRYA